MREEPVGFPQRHDLPRVGISTCLVGERVRYDGGDKRDELVLRTIGRSCLLVPVCPEYELGLGVPREPIALFGDPEDPRLVGLESGRDFTERMLSFCERRARELKGAGLHGFILKSKSPSCGIRNLEVRIGPGETVRRGVGFWARTLMREFPGLPLVESWELGERENREAFLERVLALFSGERESGPTPEG